MVPTASWWLRIKTVLDGNIVWVLAGSLCVCASLSLSPPTKENDIPPTSPSVDFSHSLLVALKIFANSCCDGAYIAKRASVVGGWAFSPKPFLYLRERKNTSLVKYVRRTLHPYLHNLLFTIAMPSLLVMKAIDRTGVESMLRLDGSRPNSEVQREADCAG